MTALITKKRLKELLCSMIAYIDANSSNADEDTYYVLTERIGMTNNEADELSGLYASEEFEED